MPSYGTCRDTGGPFRYGSIIDCFGCTRFQVTGAGTIDGQGWPWYSRFANRTLLAGRPHVLECMDCTDFSILGDGPQSDQMLRIVDSPFWTVHPYATDGVTIRYLNISNDPGTDALGSRVAPNT